MSADSRVEAVVQAGWDGPCSCPPSGPDGIWPLVDPECVPHGTPEMQAAAILAALDAYDETALRERIAAQIRTACRHGLAYGFGWFPGTPPCAACDDAARIARGTT